MSQFSRSPLTNQAIGAILHPESVVFINELSAAKGYSPDTVSMHNIEEWLYPARISFIAIHLARQYFDKDRYDQSILWLQVALENGHPDKAIILHNMGVSYIRLELWEEALGCFIYAKDAGYAHDVKIEEYITELQVKIDSLNGALKDDLNDSGIAIDTDDFTGEQCGTPLGGEYLTYASGVDDSGIFE